MVIHIIIAIIKAIITIIIITFGKFTILCSYKVS